MKDTLSSLDMYYLMGELKLAEGSKVDRIYHSKESKDEMLISFHVTGIGKKYLMIRLPGLAYFTSVKSEAGTPTGLCMALRKYLEGTIVKSISQKGFERVIEIRFESKQKGTAHSLIFELFSKGNIIFCDQDYKILGVLEQQHWSQRTLTKDSTYKFPESKHGNIKDISEGDFKSVIKASERDSIVKTLAIEFSLGGVYAEELCSITGIDKKAKAVDDKDAARLYKEFKKLFDKELRPNQVKSEVFPFELAMHAGMEKIFYESFSEAIEKNSHVDKADITRQKNLDRLKTIIDDQKKLLGETERAYEENQQKAEAIYKHYQEIDEMIKTIKAAREKYSWKEIKQRIGKDPKFSKVIKDIDEKTGTITIDITDKEVS